MNNTETNTSLEHELNKVMGKDYFLYRGVTVIRQIGGYIVLNKRCFNLDQVDDIIDNALTILVKSIKK